MRGLKTWAWVVGLAALSASPAAAQQGGITSGGQPSGVGLGQGSSALSSSGTAGGLNTSGLGNSSMGSSSGLGGTSGLGGNSSSSGSTSQATITAPTISAPTGTASSSLDKSNFLSGYYANPYYQGIASSTNSGAPGGFGNPLYGSSSGSGGRGGINTGGTSGLGGIGGSSNQNSNTNGIVIPIPVQINYAATMRFPTPPVAAPRLQTEIRVAIDNTSLIADSKNVQIITDANNNVILRGTVKDDDEVRLIEGMVRLTPGVHTIKNELTFPSR